MVAWPLATLLVGDPFKKPAAPMKLVTFTVDPQTDTPEVLANYAASHHIDTRRWTFLTGDADALEQVIVDGFKQPMGEENGGEEPTSALEIAHGVRLVLVDQRMRVRGLYDLDEAGRNQIQMDISQLAVEQEQ